MRHDGHAFEPDGKRPEDFGERVFVGPDYGEDEGADEEVLDFECVESWVVGGFVGCGHEVDGVARGGYEEDLEDGVVGGVGEGCEDVEVAGYVDDEVEGLRFEGYSGAGLGIELVV